jgi:thiamine-monophosphate kinase
MPRPLTDLGLRHAPTERSLIQGIRALQSRKSFKGLALGIGDDCALLQPKPNEHIAVTTDLSIQDRHFRLEWHPPEVVGHRTLARGLSDLAAMGARPLAAFLSLGLPAELTISRQKKPSWLDRFLEGFIALANICKTPLAGGDLAESPLATADIVLIGAVPRGRALLRSGARAGDLLYVTGTLGGAAAGLAKLREIAPKKKSTRISIPQNLRRKLEAHFHPQPRLAQGLWLQQRGAATAAIDLSDGLSTDLTHLCEESRLCAEIDTARLPIAIGASLEQALDGGEDYELLFTAPTNQRIPRRIAGVPITPIGRLVPRRRGRPSILLRKGNITLPLEPHGWQHFAR